MPTVATGMPAHRSGWTITEGVALIIIGLAAVASPFFTAEITAVVLPWIVLIEGILLLVTAFSDTVVGSKGWTIAFGIIAIVASLALFARPLMAFLTLPLIVGSFLTAMGIAQFVLGMRMTEGKGWIYASAILNVAFGLLVWAAPFGSSMVLIGIYIGASILFFGVLLLMLPAAPASPADMNAPASG